jgi:glycosyltransferase involved in cell wall biosynthesis
MKVYLDGSVCFDPFGACFDYYSQLAPRLVELGYDVVITPSPTGVLSFLRGQGVHVLEPILPSARFLPPGRIKQFLSAQKRRLQSWRLQLGAPPSDRPVLFHSFYYTPSPNPQWIEVGMVLDMIPEKHPEEYADAASAKLKQLKAETAQRAKQLICISNAARADAQVMYGLDDSKLETIYLGVDSAFRTPEVNQKPLTGRGPLLQVGGRARHKNFFRLLRAFARFSQNHAIDLVCAGERWDDSEKKALCELGIGERVKLVHRPSKQALVQLYQSASALVYPSTEEGFGIPPLEAMACGTPVLASNAKAIAEVVGDAAILFDPFDESALVDALLRLQQPGVKQHFRTKGLERVKQFNWDAIAQRTAQVYSRIANESLR